MTKVESIEKEITELSPKELSQFRAWFGEFDSAAWDRQIEKDAQSGRLDSLAQDALARHERGETKPL